VHQLLYGSHGESIRTREQSNAGMDAWPEVALNALRERPLGGTPTVLAGEPMEPILADDRLNGRQFGDLMADGLWIGALE